MGQRLAQDTRFRETWFRAGYAADEVELFVQAVEDALRSQSLGPDAADVAGHREGESGR
jgi:hypothetical protein